MTAGNREDAPPDRRIARRLRGELIDDGLQVIAIEELDLDCRFSRADAGYENELDAVREAETVENAEPLRDRQIALGFLQNETAGDEFVKHRRRDGQRRLAARGQRVDLRGRQLRRNREQLARTFSERFL